MKVKEFLNAYYGNEEIAVEVADTDIMRSTGIFHIDEVRKLLSLNQVGSLIKVNTFLK